MLDGSPQASYLIVFRVTVAPNTLITRVVAIRIGWPKPGEELKFKFHPR
jgi:hypothetical protein